jgi:rSAM/selenodomain-associated transferase 2
VSAGRETLSVIIPVLNDSAALASLLETLAAMPAGPDEVLVVDGGGDDACRAVCQAAGARWIASRPGRGAQLDAGARAAAGDWLWFLHADASPPPAGAAAIREAMTAGRAGGWFRFRFTGTAHALARLIATLTNWRCRFGVPYGDQGLFAAAAAYRRAGGFPDQPLFEEVPLVRGLRRAGTFSPLALSIGVSPRRWEQDGWLRRSLWNRALALGYMLGVPPGRLARRYRHSGRRNGPDADQDRRGPADHRER